MRSVQHLFADLRAASEDMHALAVEGQHPDHSADIQEAVLTSMRDRMRLARRIMLEIGLALL